MKRTHQGAAGALRRNFVLSALSALSTMALPGIAVAQQRTDPPQVEVWKSPNCGCCKDWVAHLEANGFRVLVHDTGNDTVRERLGIATRYASCHTARVAGYAIEGHVPATDIQRLLAEKPAAAGLAVPGMPVGSPGMDGAAYGGRRDPHDVLLIASDGSASVFQSYR